MPLWYVSDLARIWFSARMWTGYRLCRSHEADGSPASSWIAADEHHRHVVRLLCGAAEAPDRPDDSVEHCGWF